VRELFFNKGTGRAPASGDADTADAHTTVPGFFLTADQVSPFHPYKLSEGYKEILKRNRAERNLNAVKSLRLIGIQSSNNDSADSKPIHESPYRSSWGCPSISPDNSWVIDELAKNGPSLFLNYGNPKFHQSTSNCDNDGKMGLNSRNINSNSSQGSER
jgi:hypothetical protein